MQRKQIKKTQDLPPEFSLEKYRSISDCKCGDWALTLSSRVFNLAVFEINEMTKNDLDRFRRQSQFKDYSEAALTQHQEDVYTSNLDELKRSAIKFLNTPIKKLSPVDDIQGYSKHIYASHIRDITAMDQSYDAMNFLDERFNKYSSFFRRIISQSSDAIEIMTPSDFEMELLNIPVYQMSEECGIENDGNIRIEVDLHGSDQKIINDFTIWLKNARQKCGIIIPKKKFNKDDFDEWQRNAILPYLDLTFWAKVNGFEITQQLLGVSLFPNEYEINLADRIRKVVAPTARSITNEVYLNALYSQALAERAESK